MASDIFDIYERTFQFARRVVRMNERLAHERNINRDAMKQLVRAATSVGANLTEAKAGQSDADFYSKLRISLKEARESQYWLRLLHESSETYATRIKPLLNESNELVAILTTIAKKTNQNDKKRPSS